MCLRWTWCYEWHTNELLKLKNRFDSVANFRYLHISPNFTENLKLISRTQRSRLEIIRYLFTPFGLPYIRLVSAFFRSKMTFIKLIHKAVKAVRNHFPERKIKLIIVWELISRIHRMYLTAGLKTHKKIMTFDTSIPTHACFRYYYFYSKDLWRK